MQEGVGALAGDVADEVAADFPELQPWSVRVPIPFGATRRDVLRHLDALDDRLRSVATGGLRLHSVAAAYRAFARQVGLDPDTDRNPLEQLAIARLTAGQYRSGGPLHDALAIAMLETGVPLWAVDGAHVRDPLRLEADAGGRLLVCSGSLALGAVMADPDPAVLPDGGTAEAVVYTMRLGRRAPDVIVEEALWHVRSCLAE